MTRFLLPLGIFGVLIVFLYASLKLNPRDVPSPLIGKQAPAFELRELHAPEKKFTPLDNLGKVWLLNVWASWCASCREEHPLLVQLAKASIVPVYGLNYKDNPENARRWLQMFGDPYVVSFADPQGRVAIDYGVYGVPETFIIDKSGLIRYKQTGPVTAESLEKKILPLVKELQK